MPAASSPPGSPTKTPHGPIPRSATRPLRPTPPNSPQRVIGSTKRRRSANRPLLPPHKRAIVNHRLWFQLDECRGSEQKASPAAGNRPGCYNRGRSGQGGDCARASFTGNSLCAEPAWLCGSERRGFLAETWWSGNCGDLETFRPFWRFGRNGGDDVGPWADGQRGDKGPGRRITAAGVGCSDSHRCLK